MDIITILFSIKYNNNWKEIYLAFERKEKVFQADVKIIEKWKIKNKVITIIDKDYPKKKYQNQEHPPFVLWEKNQFKELKRLLLY